MPLKRCSFPWSLVIPLKVPSLTCSCVGEGKRLPGIAATAGVEGAGKGAGPLAGALTEDCANTRLPLACTSPASAGSMCERTQDMLVQRWSQPCAPERVAPQPDTERKVLLTNDMLRMPSDPSRKELAIS